MSAQPLDALFLSYFDDVDRWANDLDATSGPATGSPARRVPRDAPDGHSFLARIARESIALPEGALDLSRFLALAAHGDLRQHARYDAFAINQLSGKYYESLAAREGFTLVHLDMVNRLDVAALPARFAPRFVMLSSTFATETSHLLDAIQHVRRAYPGTPLVVGGLFLVEVQKALGDSRFQRLLGALGADVYVVSPFGEQAFLALLHGDGRADTWSTLPGAWVRRGASVAPTGVADQGVPIDAHFVRWDAVDPAGLYHVAHTRTARSCAFACAFCSYPANQGALTLEDPATLALELDSLRRSGRVRTLVFTDDTFNVPAPRFKELCRVLARYDFRWYAYFRCQFADPETIALMLDAGCQGVFLGYESLDDVVLKNMRKAVTRKAYERGTELVKRAGFATHANFIVGFPGDHAANVATALEFVDRHELDFYYFSPWFCSPATPVSNERERFGIEGNFMRWKHASMSSDEAIALCEDTIGAARHAAWLGDLGARSFWSELFLYENGVARPDARFIGRTYARLVHGATTREALRADPDVRRVGELLARGSFPVPPVQRRLAHPTQEAQRPA